LARSANAAEGASLPFPATALCAIRQAQKFFGSFFKKEHSTFLCKGNVQSNVGRCGRAGAARRGAAAEAAVRVVAALRLP